MQVGTIIEKAKEHGFQSVALVDTMSISALVPFTNACKKQGLKPVLGCTLRVFDDPTYRPPSKKSGEKAKPNPSAQIKVYVTSDAGLRSLMRVLSRGNSADNFYYTSRIGWDDVVSLEDVVIATGDIFNLFHHPEHVERLRTISAKFPVYVELVPIDTPLYDTLNEKAIAAARSLSLPLLATYPFFYPTAADADSLDVLRGITSNTQIDARTLPIPYTRDWCFDKPTALVQRMVGLAKRIGLTGDETKAALTNAGAVVERCSYEFAKLSPSLPEMAANPFLALVEQCKKGWVERFSRKVFGHQPTSADLATYKERLAYELSVLQRLGFSNYFLLTQDIVRWAKTNDVMVGPGRGSVGGSLIAYLMGITDVDPIRFNLFFERFINPDRIDLPDADLDFMSSRRQEVVEYIIGQYGRDRVAGISNYSTLGPASALRDTGRIHGLSPFDYACSKQVEKEHGVSLSLTESAETVADIAKFKDAFPTVWKHAVTLEGCMKNLGQHAAGVIVAAEPIINRAVLLNRDEAALPVVNWDKAVVEDFGLIKMDILGLSTLDVLARAREYIFERHKKRIDFMNIPLDDAKVLAEFGKGETVGVFQFEGGGMRKLLRDLAVKEPLTFEEITAATALYRPGPIDAGLVDQFVQIKQGRRAPEYDHPTLETALKDTYGVLTYQEQIMQTCRDLAGFSMAEADGVRKSMGKKDKDKMAEYREQFVAGAVANGMTAYEAGVLWDKIAGFAGYAFNKSHSVEYSIISYLTMWLKVRYPAEFFAAAMTVVDKEEKLTGLVMDARRMGITVLPPDINKSTNRIEIEGENKLYAPFQVIKGISEKVASYVLQTRRELGRPFESKADFEAAVAAAGLNAKVNKKHRECLDRVGAFASVEPGTPLPMSAERLKDRIELMPGFTVDSVKADRGLSDDRLNKLQVIKLVEEVRACEACSLKGDSHPSPTMGATPKFMMVFDTPTWQEAKAGKMLTGDGADYIRAALKDVGLSPEDGYYTALVKAPKSKDAKGLSTSQINGCSQFLGKEIDILKPAVIIAMGSNAIRYFSPGVKGSPADLAGKVIYRPDLDASIVYGLSPGSLHFDGSKIKYLQAACAKLADLIT